MNRITILLAFIVILSGCGYDSSVSSGKFIKSINKEFHDLGDSFDDVNYFNGYECTDDCSGHEAGYEWAEDNNIEDEGDCGGNSGSFIEGCNSYVEDNY